MAVVSSLRFASAVALSSLLAVGDATTYLSPDQDIVLPASGSATNPLVCTLILGAIFPNSDASRVVEP
jgi:hypothetical protein